MGLNARTNRAAAAAERAARAAAADDVDSPAWSAAFASLHLADAVNVAAADVGRLRDMLAAFRRPAAGPDGWDGGGDGGCDHVHCPPGRTAPHDPPDLDCTLISDGDHARARAAAAYAARARAAAARCNGAGSGVARAAAANAAAAADHAALPPDVRRAIAAGRMPAARAAAAAAAARAAAAALELRDVVYDGYTLRRESVVAAAAERAAAPPPPDLRGMPAAAAARHAAAFVGRAAGIVGAAERAPDAHGVAADLSAGAAAARAAAAVGTHAARLVDGWAADDDRRSAAAHAIASAAADVAAAADGAVRAAALPPAGAPADLLAAARAEWGAAAAGLPPDIRAAIAAAYPVPVPPPPPPLPALPAPPPAAMLRPAPQVGGWNDDRAEFEELDNGLDLEAMASLYLEGIEENRYLDAVAPGGVAVPGHGLAYRSCGRSYNLLGCSGPNVGQNEDARPWQVAADKCHAGPNGGQKSALKLVALRCGSPRCRTCLRQNLWSIAARATAVMTAYFSWLASAGGPGRSLVHHRVVSAPGEDYDDLRDPDYRRAYLDLVYELLKAPPIYEVFADMAPRLRSALPVAGIEAAAVDRLLTLLRDMHSGNSDRRADLNEYVYAAMRGWAAALRRARSARAVNVAVDGVYRELLRRVRPLPPAKQFNARPRLSAMRRALAVHGGLGMAGGMSVFHGWRFTKRLASAYWSPHWHFIGSGFISGRQVRALHGATGLAFVGLSSFGNTARLQRLIFYLFTHAAVRRRRPLMTYFGNARGGHDVASIPTGATSGFDDIEALVGRMMAPMDRPPAAYDRAMLAAADMQDVVLPAGDIGRARRLPIVRVNPDGHDIEAAMQGLVEFDPDDPAAGRRPPKLTANAPMAKSGGKSAAGGGPLSDTDGVVRIVRLTWRLRARRRLVPILETWIEKSAVFVAVCDRFPVDTCPHCHGVLKHCLPKDEGVDLGMWEVLDDDGKPTRLGSVDEGAMVTMPAGVCPFRPWAAHDHYDGARGLVRAPRPITLDTVAGDDDDGQPDRIRMVRFFGQRPLPDFMHGMPPAVRADLRAERDDLNARACHAFAKWWLWREYRENDGDRPDDDMITRMAAECKVHDDGVIEHAPPAAAPPAARRSAGRPGAGGAGLGARF